MAMPGGYSEAPANDERAAKAEEVAIGAIKAQYGEDVIVEDVERQVVAGMNYRIRLRYGDRRYLVVAFESLPNNGQTAFTVTSIDSY